MLGERLRAQADAAITPPAGEARIAFKETP
jgi:hypothetical protein